MPAFRVIKYQGAIFTPDLSISNSFAILKVIVDLLGEKLQGEPMILPIPQDAPAEIPRMQLTSQDKKWILTMSLARTDLIFVDPSNLEPDDMDVQEFSGLCSAFFSKLKEKLNIRVQRLAFVTDRASQNEQAADLIVKKFCKDELAQDGKPFNNVNNFEIHSLKSYDWKGYSLNSWVRIKASDLRIKEEVVPALVVQNDLNTLPLDKDSGKDFSQEEIGTFFREIPAHLLDILKKYGFE
mgnify:CR=1 FL=1|jgi:hypothetical protein